MTRRAAGTEAVVSQNATIAAELLLAPPSDHPGDLAALYEANHQPVERHEVKVGGDQANVLYMSELLLGHPDSAVDFYDRTVEQVRRLPENMKPDVAVVSGFLQGAFNVRDKPRRKALVPGLDTLDAQFRHARQKLEELQSTGVPVVYTMSSEDRAIGEEITTLSFRRMQNEAKGNREVNWGDVDKMQRHPAWPEHALFTAQTVFPYCLRAGRQLYTAEEMAQRTGGEVSVDEYMLLFRAEQAAKQGRAVEPSHAKWLDDVRRQQNNTLVITDDVDMHVTTKGREYWDMVRHHMGFSSKPMYQNHMSTPMGAMGRLASSGEASPSSFVTMHQQEMVGVAMGDSWVLSTAGLTHPLNFLSARGSRADVAGDTSRRMATTRRRIPEPGAHMHTRTDDGRDIFTFFNDELMRKSEGIPERITIAELCDLQTGSITARPDILAKYLDYIRTRALGERATALFFGGDMLHGRNYPHFASESQQTGLMSMAAQEDFNVAMFREAFKDVTPEELKALDRVLVQPGNHEWNSGTLKWHGYPFTTYMRDFFGRMLARAGVSDEEIARRVKSHEAVVTQKGEYAGGGYTGIEYFGEADMGVLIRHYLLERGGKGSGGDLPVYQAAHLANGAADLLRSVDVLMAGHWHHPQLGVFGNKLAVVGGSIAGLSDYELTRGYRPTIAGTLIHIGGGLPPQIEFVSERALHNHQITTGGFAQAVLREKGYRDDRNFDPVRHGIFLPDADFPKSALQKYILKIMRDASQRTGSYAVTK